MAKKAENDINLKSTMLEPILSRTEEGENQ